MADSSRTLSKSSIWVLLVVPTSIRLEPDFVMSSGSLKLPPISTSSPRETGTNFPRANVFKTNINAAALLLTIAAASHPVSLDN